MLATSFRGSPAVLGATLLAGLWSNTSFALLLKSGSRGLDSGRRALSTLTYAGGHPAMAALLWLLKMIGFVDEACGLREKESRLRCSLRQHNLQQQRLIF